jgi:hypothetical protein
MTPAIAAVGLYAGLLGLIAIWLGFIVGNWRRKTGVLVGDGGNIDLIRAMRGQANFTETVPLTLILMIYMAIAGAPAIAIHILGILLVIARIVHGLHFSRADQPRWQRGMGSGLAFLVLLAAALGAIGHSLPVMF